METGRQIEKWRWKGDDRDKICVHICILYSHRLTHHMYSTHADISFSHCTNEPRQAGRWKEKEASVHIVVFTPWMLSVYIEVQRREPARLPGQTVKIVLCLFLEWRDRPSCHLLSLDWLASLPVALASRTKPALISEPRGVLALEF